jgi:hypothetical protein
MEGEPTIMGNLAPRASRRAVLSSNGSGAAEKVQDGRRQRLDHATEGKVRAVVGAAVVPAGCGDPNPGPTPERGLPSPLATVPNMPLTVPASPPTVVPTAPVTPPTAPPTTPPSGHAPFPREPSPWGPVRPPSPDPPENAPDAEFVPGADPERGVDVADDGPPSPLAPEPGAPVEERAAEVNELGLARFDPGVPRADVGPDAPAAPPVDRA